MYLDNPVSLLSTKDTHRWGPENADFDGAISADTVTVRGVDYLKLYIYKLATLKLKAFLV